MQHLARFRDGFDGCLAAVSQRGKVTHFAARPRFVLAVEMKMNAFCSECGRPVWLTVAPDIPQQVRHRGRSKNFGGAERQAANRPDVLFELARRAALDGLMPGVVRSRSQLIDQQFPVALEKHFDCQDADERHLLRDGAREIGG